MKYFSLILLVIIYSNLIAQTDKSLTTKEDRKKFYDEISEKYASDNVQKIWKSDASLQEFDQWVDGRIESEVIKEFGVCIHELYHGICKQTENGQTYYINKDLSIEVNYTDVFKSTELNKWVRKGQQDSIFRYGIYVGGKNTLPDGVKLYDINTNSSNQIASIQLGIYGLLEEFCAYYYETFTNLYLKKYYLDKYGIENQDALDTYKHKVLSQGIAYEEFRIYISWYLIHAKKNSKKVYDEIQNNKPLRVVYTIMTDKFSALMDSIDIEFASLPSDADDPTAAILSLDGTGSDEDLLIFFELMAITEDEEIYKEEKKLVNGKSITKLIVLDQEEFDELKIEYEALCAQITDLKRSNSDASKQNDLLFYYASPLVQIEYLKSQFTSEMKSELKKLRIDGVTEKNYKEYLK